MSLHIQGFLFSNTREKKRCMFNSRLKSRELKGFLALSLIIFPLFGFFPLTSVNAEKRIEVPEQVMSVEAKAVDKRVVVLKDYLEKYDSPLVNQASDFVEAADLYGVDWKLVPAISGVESTFGKQIPGGFNAWGWGVYGNQALGFESWRHGIFTVTKGLRENYINKGLTEPFAMNKVYASSTHWGTNVTYFMTDLEKFSQPYEINNNVAPVLTAVSDAGESARLKSRILALNN